MNARTLPVHAPVEAYPVSDNCLIVGGIKLTQLAEQVGRTPFYVYDSAFIAKRLRSLREAIPAAVKLHYAVKANPMPAVVNFIAPNVDGMDIASDQEMQIALDAGMPAANISFAGPGKRVEELRKAVAAGITVTIESPTEMQRLADIAAETGTRPPVAVRVNPDFELKSSGMRMSGGPKPFGIDADRVPDILKQLASMPLSFTGLHIFCGSQNLQTDAIIEAHTNTLELALRLLEVAPNPPRFVNIGGGLGIPYFKGDTPVDLSAVGENLGRLAEQAAVQLPDTHLVIELGRYIVGEAGLYVCRVQDRKESRGQVFLITDGGLHHHLAASGNFGQVIRKNYPLLVGNRVFSNEQESQSIVGPLCTPLDLLGDRMLLPKADIGDLIVVMQSGAYGYSASPLNFLSHPYPAEILA